MLLWESMQKIGKAQVMMQLWLDRLWMIVWKRNVGMLLGNILNDLFPMIREKIVFVSLCLRTDEPASSTVETEQFFCLILHGCFSDLTNTMYEC